MMLEHDFGGITICSSCIQASNHFDKARSVFKYDDFSGRVITGFKYSDKTYLAEQFANLLLGTIKKNIDSEDYDIITSVPISFKRLLGRKYNQSAMLANKLGQKLNMNVDNSLLLRVKSIPPQTGLRRKERLKNVKNVFEISSKPKNFAKGAGVILVDDVFTTGATLNECAKVLKKAGAENIFAVTLARTYIN
jgi:ComF family protein